MRLAARYACEAIDWGTPLSRAHAQGTLVGNLRAPGILEADAHRVRPDASPALVEALGREPHAGTWTRLGVPGARCVITGQQPGAAGGPALVLYKVATAVALAARLEARSGVPVVPVFWNATDDEDFEEIARTGFVDDAGRLLFLELPRNSHSGWVGDLPADADRRAAEAVLQGPPPGVVLPAGAPDHGTWVAAFVGTVFPEVAIVDARCPALRTHAVPLFERYLQDPGAAQARVESQIEALVARGFDRTLAPGSLRSGLFLTPDRRREKPGSDLAPLWSALKQAPQSLSPNVLLRVLVQDALLPTVAQVVGPAEIGYLIELRALRAAWDIPEPALVPRLTATLLPQAQWSALERAGLDAHRWLLAPAAAIDEAAVARTARAQTVLAQEFARWPERLAEWGIPAAAQGKAIKRLDAAQAEIGAALRDRARAGLLAELPDLRALEAWVRPRGRAQERVLGAFWVRCVLGAATRDALLRMAHEHLEALGSQRAEHFVGVYEGTGA